MGCSLDRTGEDRVGWLMSASVGFMRLYVTGALVSGNPERAYYVCRATRACEMGNAC